MIFILGKTGSGKTTIVNELVKNYGFNKIITYTTRPMRNGETNHKDYHFINNKDFINKVNEDFFAEWKTYATKSGIWHSGISLLDFLNANTKSIVIITPEGIRALREKYNFDIFSIYIDCDEDILEERINNRGDNPIEINRRLKADKKDFEFINKDVDRVVFNNGNLEITIQDILKLIKERNNNIAN